MNGTPNRLFRECIGGQATPALQGGRVVGRVVGRVPFKLLFQPSTGVVLSSAAMKPILICNSEKASVFRGHHVAD